MSNLQPQFQYALVEDILYSCVSEKYRDLQSFIPDHVVGYIISGQMELFQNGRTYFLNPGEMGFMKRNQLIKVIKHPGENGEPFSSISIFMNQEILRDFCIEYQTKADGVYTGEPMKQYPNQVGLISLFASLIPYFTQNIPLVKSLAALKVKEAILTLLQVDPELKNILFDFNKPGKIDLEEFMNQNYAYNVPIKRFAQLTGKSLATFKRDFEKIFHLPPNRWLQQKRLQEAHYLIGQKNRKPSDVYLEVGFENLSHFSFSFKKAFGYNPSTLV